MVLFKRSHFPTLNGTLFCAILTAFFITPGPSRAQTGVIPQQPTETQLQEILDILEDFAVDRMIAEGIPGMAYAIVKDDQVIYAKGFGVRKQGEPDAVDENTLFEVGSITKSFTATLIAKLVDEGKFKWTDRVRQHLPGFKMKQRWVTREMQIADLLCHRSGMPEYQLDTMAFLGFDRPEIVQAARWVEPVTSFRSAFAYSNTLYVAAGQVIKEKRGRTWEEDLNENLLQPLGMYSSTGNPDTVPSTNVATGHIILSDGSLWPIPEDWRYNYALKTNAPAGGIYSNIADMTQWLRFQLANGSIDGQRLVSAENLTVTRAPRTLMGSDLSGVHSSYAMGWQYDALPPQPLIWHNGGTTGMHSAMGIVPGANIGIVVLSNAQTVDAPEQIMYAFHFLYFNWQAALVGNTLDNSVEQFLESVSAVPAAGVRKQLSEVSTDLLSSDVNTNPVDERGKLGRYAGVYENPAYGRFSVEVQDNSLVLTMGPAELKSPLLRYQRNRFISAFPDFPETEFLVTFIIGRGGLVTGLVATPYSDVNGGLFKKHW